MSAAPVDGRPKGVRILDRHEIDAASHPAYERLRRRLLLARLRVAAVISLAGQAAAAVVNVLWAPDRIPERLVALALQALLSLVALACAVRGGRTRHPGPIVAGFVLGEGIVLLYQLTLSPTDVGALTPPVIWVMIGSMLLFPWGAAMQAVVSIAMLLGYVTITAPHPGGAGMQGTNLVLGTSVGVVLSVIGAFVLEASRRSAFEERQRVHALAVQRRRLIDVGRELRSTLSLDGIKQRLVVHAKRLIPADFIRLTLADPGAARYRIAAATGEASTMIDVEWDDGFAAAFRAAFAPAEVRECPGGPLDALVLPAMRPLGVRRVLVAAVGPHPIPAGFISWHRRSDHPFTAGERLAAQGIADQAFTALSAARLFEDAATASRLKSEFVSTMSHELRTPLNVIMGYNQILAEVVPPEAETTQALDAVRRASLELLDLVEATLDLGRLEAGGERVREEPVHVRELFDELAREFADVPRSAGVALLWEPGPAPLLSTDRRKLKTVMKNLVGNALKFTPAGSVRVECRTADDRCELRVIDTGVGIRAEDQAIVFEMFRQADSSDSRPYGGTGLGLYIVRQLVHLLDGRITLESTPGHGSVFTVVLPLSGNARERSAA